MTLPISAANSGRSISSWMSIMILNEAAKAQGKESQRTANLIDYD
jgi:hypothetical protein